MDAIINVYKPGGMSSFQCVSQVRRITGTKKAGHAGTLDPEATGVLPVCTGSATRLSAFFLHCDKSYRGKILFGRETDTRDIWGKITGRADTAFVTESSLNTVLSHFTGEITQIPPAFSAIKKDGVPLYKLARQGKAAEAEPRQVCIYEIETEAFSVREFDGDILPEATIRVTCSKGTYIRSLFHDIGRALGTVACMSELERISYGPMRVEDSISLAELAEHPEASFSPEYILKNYPYTELNEIQARAYLQGKPVRVSQILPGDGLSDWPAPEPEVLRVRLNGQLFALAHIQGGILKPWKFLGGI